MSDTLFVTETVREAKRLDAAGHNVWLYKFEHYAPLFDQFRHDWPHLHTRWGQEIVFVSAIMNCMAGPKWRP